MTFMCLCRITTSESAQSTSSSGSCWMGARYLWSIQRPMLSASWLSSKTSLLLYHEKIVLERCDSQ